jgi:hypothetical protein
LQGKGNDSEDEQVMDVLVIFTDNRLFLLQAVAPKTAQVPRANNLIYNYFVVSDTHFSADFWLIDIHFLSKFPPSFMYFLSHVIPILEINTERLVISNGIRVDLLTVWLLFYTGYIAIDI